MDKNEVITHVKDYWRELIAGAIIIWFLIQMQGYIGCSYHISPELTVYGDCDDIRKYEEKKVKEQLMMAERIALTEQIKPLNMSEIIFINATTTTTTTIPCPPPRECPITECTCPVCTKCPSCDFELSEKQNKEILNWHPSGGSSGYQAGAMDCKDWFMEYLDVEGRPKFKSKPPSDISPYGWGKTTSKEEGMYCFRDMGGYYIVNRTPHIMGNISRPRWGWNDEQCKKSWIRINHL